MKKIIWLSLLILACGSDDEADLENVILPLTVGNEWVYDFTDQVAPFLDYEIVRRVIDKDTLGYSVLRQEWFNIWSNFEYKNEADGLYRNFNGTDLIRIKYPMELDEEYSFFVSDQLSYQVKLNSKDTLIQTDAGSFRCYNYRHYSNGTLAIDAYYAVGIGMIKERYFDIQSLGIGTGFVELKSYNVK